MRLRKAFALAVGCLFLGVVPSLADTFQSFAGNNIGAPTFNRPIGAGPGLSGQIVHYSAQRFVLTADTNCTIYSTQNYDGYLHLYQGSFNPASPATNLIDGDDDGELGVGTSRIPRDLDVNSVALTEGFYTLVNSGFFPTSEGSFQMHVQCNGDVQPIPSTCYFGGYPRDQQLCLNDRFGVKIDNVTNHPGDGHGTPVRFASKDSAFFWFYGDTNYEVVVKVLYGCPVNGHWWVYIAGLTDQGHRIQVGDVTDGTIRTYTRTLGPPAPAITDVNAFDCP